MTTMDPPDVTVLKLLARGRAPGWVSQATGRDRADIEAVGARHGWPDRTAMRHALAGTGAPDVARPVPAPPTRTAPEGIPSPSTAPRPIDGPRSVPGQIELLLARAGEHDQVAVRRAHDRVLAACGRLHATLCDVETRQREHQAKQAARAEARARVETLERELREAKALLRAAAPGPGAPATPAAGAPGPGAKTIRTWAATHNVDCPRVGHVPTRVLDAYLAAHTTADRRTA